ncbi:transcriptional regulator, SarA/Rot family [Staphylococcus caprae]|uniref:transcriptional regulator, SarA/Rot family n=1 Tax=Staphylococcus caprae TaxID=29380 RepID=UPI00145147D4|nr:hypothetical protein [Staphylococcus caprae]QJE26696.1 hypothetical protein HHJ99_13070 [Staphylococcus caprae]
MNLEQFFKIKKTAKDIDKELQSEMEISDEEATVMHYLYHRNGELVPIKQVVEDTGLKYSIANRAINKMYLNQKIEKERKREDQRTVYIGMSNQQLEDVWLVMELIEEKIKDINLV